MARTPKTFYPFCLVPGCCKHGNHRDYCKHHWHKMKTYGNPLATCGNRDPISLTHPEIARELVHKKDAILTYGSNKKALWKCLKGHEYRMSISNRVRGAGCSACNGGNVLIVGGNDLATRFPELAKEALFDPSQVIAGSKQILPWRCNKCMFVWKASCSRRTEKGKATGCPRCRRPRVWPGFNDLATTHPQLVSELADRSQATSICANSSKKEVEWICQTCAGIYKTRPSNRTRGVGCPVCHPGGFNKSAPVAWVYLLFRDGQQKVGITAQVRRRIKAHRKNGWHVVDLIKRDGQTAAALEKQFLFVLDKLGIQRGSKAFRESFDGWSESWQTVDFYAENLDAFQAQLYSTVWSKVFSLC